MLKLFDFVRDFTVLSVPIRLVAAILCGGCIGVERELKRRTAGFRTHILICLGAAITTLTSQYLMLEMHYYTDISRLGAQVIAGVGFIGAGTIIVTKNKRIKGLTTAAGLWVAAIVGLACGAGYLELALAATIMVMIAEFLLIKLERNFSGKIGEANLYIEYAHASVIETVMRTLKQNGIKVSGLEITRTGSDKENHYYCAMVTIEVSKKTRSRDIVGMISEIDNVRTVEEL